MKPERPRLAFVDNASTRRNQVEVAYTGWPDRNLDLVVEAVHQCRELDAEFAHAGVGCRRLRAQTRHQVPGIDGRLRQPSRGCDRASPYTQPRLGCAGWTRYLQKQAGAVRVSS